ncbi:MAG: hypothetical protein E6I45_06070 [Chloroflexi bacterium]|nr:MAG: hypothetical protein E6I45_06070 [Chloroflexota bacterium]
MSEQRQDIPDPTVLHLLQPDEQLYLKTRAIDAVLAVTDRRLLVADDQRVLLDISYDRLRRVQFDIERSRPATLVIVPESPSDEPQLLAIPPEEYERAARALAVIGERLSES